MNIVLPLRQRQKSTRRPMNSTVHQNCCLLTFNCPTIQRRVSCQSRPTFTCAACAGQEPTHHLAATAHARASASLSHRPAVHVTSAKASKAARRFMGRGARPAQQPPSQYSVISELQVARKHNPRVKSLLGSEIFQVHTPLRLHRRNSCLGVDRACVHSAGQRRSAAHARSVRMPAFHVEGAMQSSNQRLVSV